MSHLQTDRAQYFTAYYEGKVILSFTISPVYKVFRSSEIFYTQEHTSVDSLITEIQEWKAKGVTEIESWGYNDEGGYCYSEYESDESLEQRKAEYEVNLREQEEAYTLAFSICHLVSIGEFAEADRKLTKLRNTKWMYNLKEVDPRGLT